MNYTLNLKKEFTDAQLDLKLAYEGFLKLKKRWQFMLDSIWSYPPCEMKKIEEETLKLENLIDEYKIIMKQISDFVLNEQKELLFEETISILNFVNNTKFWI